MIDANPVDCPAVVALVVVALLMAFLWVNGSVGRRGRGAAVAKVVCGVVGAAAAEDAGVYVGRRASVPALLGGDFSTREGLRR